MTDDEEGGATGRYIVVKALEDGVVIMGLTRGWPSVWRRSLRVTPGPTRWSCTWSSAAEK